MEAFDAVRRAAASLHDALVAAGSRHVEPLAMVERGISTRGLELFWVKTDDPALKGARALFDEQSGAVFCEDAGNDAARALLVAHELGHVVFHETASVCTADDIDISRSLEEAPVGLQRVEDYGARERRELQANVFGREFLLPRSLARRLHVVERQSASDIARSTGLPLDVVRQQLFDALLLPEPPAPRVASAMRASHADDASQIRGIRHRNAPFLLQAGPGTGKTRTLVGRIVSLLADGVDPSSILVLTFSNRAAGELLERITAAAPDAAPRIWVGTFHSFGLDLIRRHHDKLGVAGEPTLFDRSDAIAMLEERLPTLQLEQFRNLWDPSLDLREIVGAISRAKDELVDPERYRELAAAMLESATSDDERAAAKKCVETADVYKIYDEEMRARGAFDFGDLIMRPALLLESDAEVRVATEYRHRHVLVDEYQDVNRASARLVRALAGDGKRLWIVGDTRQSIYRFRGASSSNMTLYKTDYPGAVEERLDVNYRSTSQVVDTLSAFAPTMHASSGMLPLALTAARGTGPARPSVRVFETPVAEAAGIAMSIRELEAEGVPLHKQALLCRSNGRLSQLAQQLQARGVPVLHLGSLFERDEIRDLLAYLSLAVDRFASGLVRVAAMPRYRIPLKDVRAVSQYLMAEMQAPLVGLNDAASKVALSDEGRIGIKRLVEDLATAKSGDMPWDFLATFILDRSDIARDVASATSVAEQMRGVALWQFLNFVRERVPAGAGAGPPILRVLDRIRQLVLLAEERDLRQVPAAALHVDAVRLMTVHGSKGLEFEAVHVPGLTVSSFPAQPRGDRVPVPTGLVAGDEDGLRRREEEECLFFVAMSRARTHLHIYRAEKMANGNNRKPSEYLDRLPATLVDELRPAVTPDALGTADSNIRVDAPESWTITDSMLTSYENCPRRFFYTHALGLAGARKPTAFTSTHDCVQMLIAWLTANERRTTRPSLAEAEAAFEVFWQEHGPHAHAFAQQYRQLASRMIKQLVDSRIALQSLEKEPLPVSLASGSVVVEPTEIAKREDGTIVVRRLRTGYRRKTEMTRREYPLYLLAARQRFGDGAVVEVLHLTDGKVDQVTYTDKKLKNDLESNAALVAKIRAGQFPPKPDAMRCPRCPHFFVCAASASGSLSLAEETGAPVAAASATDDDATDPG